MGRDCMAVQFPINLNEVNLVEPTSLLGEVLDIVNHIEVFKINWVQRESRKGSWMVCRPVSLT